MLRSNTRKVQRGLWELDEGARRIGFADRLDVLAWAGAMCSGLFEHSGFNGSQGGRWAVVLAGDHEGVFPSLDDRSGRGTTSQHRADNKNFFKMPPKINILFVD